MYLRDLRCSGGRRGGATKWDEVGWNYWVKRMMVLPEPVEEPTPEEISGPFPEEPNPKAEEPDHMEPVPVPCHEVKRAIPHSGSMNFEGDIGEVLETVTVLLGGHLQRFVFPGKYANRMAQKWTEVLKMREILFRGKTKDRWAYGSLIDGIAGAAPVIVTLPSVDDYFKLDFEYEHVYPETIGQYTGLTDKNGKKIFEGDIIKTHYRNAKKASFTEQVVFHNGRFCSLYKMPGAGNGKMWANLPDGVPYLPQDKTVYMESCEVIGNIYDNPELLGGADND